MKIETVKYGTVEHLEHLRKKIPYVDLDVAMSNISRCPGCKRLPRWTTCNSSAGYELACECQKTTTLASRKIAIKAWEKLIAKAEKGEK